MTERYPFLVEPIAVTSELGMVDGMAPSGSLLVERNAFLDAEVQASLAAKREAVLSTELPPSNGYFANRMHDTIAWTIQAIGHDPGKTDIAQPSRKDATTQNFDLAFNVGAMARRSNPDGPDQEIRTESPEEIAEELAGQLAEALSVQEAIASTETAGAFVNIKLDYLKIAPIVLAEVATYGDHYGHSRNGKPETIIVDFSSPNVAKNMTVAHLRSTIIGDSLRRLHEAAGNVSFGINHIGDWGTQFGNIIYQYNEELATRGEEFITELNADPTATLMRIYRKFTENIGANPDSVPAGRELFHRLEQGDPDLINLWAQFREWSLRDFAPAYHRLGVHFDAIQGESFYEDRMPSTVKEAIDEGVLVVDEAGAIVFPSQPLTDPSTGKVNDRLMLDKKGKPRPEIIVKPNGGTVYLTRDLAAVSYRAKELGADKILYVIGKEQGPHCMILLNMAAKLGHMALGSAQHITFGHLNVDGRKMKSREGKVVLLNDILDESTAAAADMLVKRKAARLGQEVADVKLDETELETARIIGNGAVIFNDLHQARVKDIDFRPDMAANLEAGGSTYVQYTNARLGSILEKAGDIEPLHEMPETLATEEAQLISQIAGLPAVIREAAEMNAPHKVATYLTTLCQNVSAFYQTQPILNASSATERTFRLHLARAAKQTIGNTAYLLNLGLPAKM